MLTTLKIQGFAVVDALEVVFGPGLNVVTGETGAGKSILVQAMGLVLGGRAPSGVLRDGADEAVVEALFELPAAHPVLSRLTSLGLRGEEDAPKELLIRRVVARSGRNRVFVNGALCTVAMLGELMRGLVDLAGQHEHMTLLDVAGHLQLLDGYAGLSTDEGLLSSYRARYGELAALTRERDLLVRQLGERISRAEFLDFQLSELDALDPKPGEELELEQARKVLASAAKLADAAAAAEREIYAGEGSAAERLGAGIRSLGDLAGIDPRLEEPLALLRSASAEVEEAARSLGRYVRGVALDPGRLETIEERLDALKRICRKHGGSVEAALHRREEMRFERASLSSSDERLSSLEGDIAARSVEAADLARALTAARVRAAPRFCRAVETDLAALAMGRCKLEIQLSPVSAGLTAQGLLLGPDGAERAELLISPNTGEPPRPLARIASGGELSRTMLAIKRTLSGGNNGGAEPEHTICQVMDEVDAGVGGAVAAAVGRMLKEVAHRRQVISVTHSPQIAAYGERHLKVEKRVQSGRTSTTVAQLASEDLRCGELARMLAGKKITPSALAHARALIESAEPRPRSVRRSAVQRSPVRQAGG